MIQLNTHLMVKILLLTHIIPENKLKAVYAKIKAILTALPPKEGDITPMLADNLKALGRNWSLDVQLKEYAHDINNALGTNIDEDFLGDCLDISSEQDGKNSVIIVDNNEVLANLAEKKITTEQEAKFKKLFLKQTKEIKIRDFTTTSQDKKGYENELHARMCWIIGNIHEGPACDHRIQPDNKQTMSSYDPLKDDGGNAFEYSAEKIVSPTQYELLKKLNDEIDNLIGKDLNNCDWNNLENNINAIFMLMNQLMNPSYFTSFNSDTAKKWEAQSIPLETKKPSTTEKMRIK